jgi:hypothetical protein
MFFLLMRESEVTALRLEDVVVSDFEGKKIMSLAFVARADQDRPRAQGRLRRGRTVGRGAALPHQLVRQSQPVSWEKRVLVKVLHGLFEKAIPTHIGVLLHRNAIHCLENALCSAGHLKRCTALDQHFNVRHSHLLSTIDEKMRKAGIKHIPRPHQSRQNGVTMLTEHVSTDSASMFLISNGGSTLRVTVSSTKPACSGAVRL